MKRLTKQHWLTTMSILFAMPTAYFIAISILKYEFGVHGPFDSIAPWLESMGIKEPPGWNINLLILLGPVIACLLAIFQVLKLKCEFGREEFQLHVSIRKQWLPLLITAFSLGLLATLFVYIVGENCRCN